MTEQEIRLNVMELMLRRHDVNISVLAEQAEPIVGYVLRGGTHRSAGVGGAITELEIRLHTLENNIPIEYGEGGHEQAMTWAATAADIRRALEILRAA